MNINQLRKEISETKDKEGCINFTTRYLNLNLISGFGILSEGMKNGDIININIGMGRMIVSLLIIADKRKYPLFGIDKYDNSESPEYGEMEYLNMVSNALAGITLDASEGYVSIALRRLADLSKKLGLENLDSAMEVGYMNEFGGSKPNAGNEPDEQQDEVKENWSIRRDLFLAASLESLAGKMIMNGDSCERVVELTRELADLMIAKESR